MNTKLIILSITYILLFADILSLAMRRKKVSMNSGSLKMKLTDKPKATFIATYIACFLLPAILFFRNFSTASSIILCGAAVLGCEIATRDFCLLGIYGVYEKCIITGGTTVWYDDIVTFPILNLPADEQEKYDHANLVAATKSKGNINLIFASEKECSEATNIIREITKL